MTPTTKKHRVSANPSSLEFGPTQFLEPPTSFPAENKHWPETWRNRYPKKSLNLLKPKNLLSCERFYLGVLDDEILEPVCAQIVRLRGLDFEAILNNVFEGIYFRLFQVFIVTTKGNSERMFSLETIYILNFFDELGGILYGFNDIA